jgi:hypothetical protein
VERGFQRGKSNPPQDIVAPLVRRFMKDGPWDGPHLFRIAVPLKDPSGATAELEVYFKALFR